MRVTDECALLTLLFDIAFCSTCSVFMYDYIISVTFADHPRFRGLMIYEAKFCFIFVVVTLNVLLFL